MNSPPSHDAYQLGRAALRRSDLAAKVWSYLRRSRKQDDERARRIRVELEASIGAEHQTSRDLAVALGLLAFEIRSSLKRQRRTRRNREELEHLARWVGRRLGALSIEVIDPEGREFTEELYDLFAVDSVPKSGVRSHLVGETIEPTIRFAGKVVLFGKVIGWAPVPPVQQG